MIDSWDSTTKLLASVFSDTDVGRDDSASENKTDTTSIDSLEQQGCLKENKLHWIERWWELKQSKVKIRIISKRLKSKRRGTVSKPTFTNISLEEYIAYENTPKDVYFVSLNAPSGVGMSLFVSYEGQVFVEGLHKLRSGLSSPAQNCSLINIGDQLIQLNKINIEALSFYETADLLKDLDLLAKNEVLTLGFRYGDVLPALSEEPDELITVDDDEAVSDNDDHDDSDAASEATRTSATTNKRLLSQTHLPVEQRSPLQPQRHSSSATEHSLSFRQSPAVEDSFLALFGGGGGGDSASYSAASAALGDVPITHGSDFGALSGVLQSLRDTRGPSRRPEPVPFTTYSDIVHYDIRRKHMYPTAARVSSNTGIYLEAHLLEDLAKDVFEWRPLHYGHQYAGFYTPRAPDDVHTPHSAMLSRLIATPPDRAQYRYTEQLVWSESLQGYVSVPVVAENALGTFVDVAEPMKDVLVGLQREFEGDRAKHTHLLSWPAQEISPSSRAFQGGVNPSTSTGGRSNSQNKTKIKSRPAGTGNQHTRSPDVIPPSTQEVQVFQVVPIAKHTVGAGSSAISVLGPVLVSAAKCAVKTSVYTRRASIIPPKTAYYSLRAYDQLISPEHTAVQRLLALDSSHLLRQLSTFVDQEIENIAESSGEKNPYLNARHLNTETDISIPPILLTYQILYAVQQLKTILLENEPLLDILDRWATTFNPKGVINALKGKNYAAQPPVQAPLQNQFRHSPQQQHNVMDNRSPPHKRTFLVYFNNDRQTARDLQGYIDVVTELLSLLLLRRVAPQCLHFTDTAVATSLAQTTETCSLGRKSFALLPVSVSALDAGGGGKGGAGHSSRYPDAVASSFVRKFGLLLLLDCVAMGASATGYSLTLEATLEVATWEAAYMARAEYLQGLLTQSVHTMLSAQELINKLQRYGGIGNNTAATTGNRFPDQVSSISSRSPLLCLLLHSLPVIFAQNPQLALDLTTLLYPQVSPWNVQQVLFPPDVLEDIPEWDVGFISEITTPVASPRVSQVYPLPVASVDTCTTNERAQDSQAPLLSRQTEKDLERILTLRRPSSHSLNGDTATPTITVAPGYPASLQQQQQLRGEKPRATVDRALRGGLCAQHSYYSYLARLLRSRPELCHTRPDLVLSWLDVSLCLAKQDSLSTLDLQPFHDAFATPRGKKKNPFSITVRNIVQSSDEYEVDVLPAMQACTAAGHYEGVVLLGARWVEAEGMPLIAQDLSVVLDLLSLALGGQLDHLLALIQHTYSTDDATARETARATARSSTRTNSAGAYTMGGTATAGSPATDNSPPIATAVVQVTGLLRLLVTAMRTASSSSTTAYRNKNTLWLLLGDILSQIVHERFYEFPAMAGRVFEPRVLSTAANFLGEALRFAVGTDSALVVLQEVHIVAQLM